MPEDVHLIESLRVAYIVFPSVQAAAKIFEVKSITYITNITDHNTYTTAMETTVHEDWICDYVNIKLN